MAEFKRLRELEAAMIPVADRMLSAYIVPAAMASLGRVGREILVGGFDEEDRFVPGTLRNHLLVFTSVEELEKAGLTGLAMGIKELLRFAADHADELDGVTINPENQNYSLGQQDVAEILDLIGEDDPEDKDADFDDPLGKSGEPTFGTAITMRSELLAACEEGRILAVAMPESE